MVLDLLNIVHVLQNLDRLASLREFGGFARVAAGKAIHRHPHAVVIRKLHTKPVHAQYRRYSSVKKPKDISLHVLSVAPKWHYVRLCVFTSMVEEYFTRTTRNTTTHDHILKLKDGCTANMAGMGLDAYCNVFSLHGRLLGRTRR